MAGLAAPLPPCTAAALSAGARARGAGLTNGRLFSRVMANSPGGILPILAQGRPPVFVSAGVQDTLFPVSQGGDSVRPSSPAMHHLRHHGVRSCGVRSVAAAASRQAESLCLAACLLLLDAGGRDLPVR